MSNIAIRAENLGKRYRLGQAQPRYDTLRDALAHGLRGPRTWIGRQGKAARGDAANAHWALKDISFEVNHGEVIGVIGRNGAGKSTLLKVLSRITEPTVGRAVIHGRVGSLLEVGTGFHPELTGRENIYLNGAILGMRRDEIDRKFDEIVAFSELGSFLDTPVKRYSSGMYVRLAFAVAAHLEPEILVVDEVLAVGDVQFQQKCLGKMQDVAHRGRTVIFVSHNMDAVQRLCSRCLLLDRGTVALAGPTADAVRHYLSQTTMRGLPGEWIDISTVPSTRGTGEARFVALQYHTPNEATSFRPYPNGPVTFRLAIESDKARTVGSVSVVFFSRSGTKLVNADSIKLGQSIQLEPGRNTVRFDIDRLYLTPGTYNIGLWLADPIEAAFSGTVLDYREEALEVEVVDYRPEGLGMRPESDGVVVTDFQVTLEAATEPHDIP